MSGGEGVITDISDPNFDNPRHPRSRYYDPDLDDGDEDTPEPHDSPKENT